MRCGLRSTRWSGAWSKPISVAVSQEAYLLSRPGGGKSGGFRTIIAARLGRRAFFVEGFAKNERASLEEDELAALRKLARDLLGMDEATLRLALERKKVTEI